MKAFEVYCDYLALKRHFSSDYDYFKYNGKVSASVASFEKRRDKVFFERLARHCADPHEFLVANLSVNEKAWIRDLAYAETAKELHEGRERRLQSLTYTIKTELGALDGSLDSILKSSEYGPPALLRAYVRGIVSLETLVVVVSAVGCYGAWNKKYGDDPMISEILFKMKKYLPFVTYDLTKVRQILVDMYKEDR